MNTAENKRAIVVGIFILLAIVIFVAAVLTLGGQQKRFIQSISISTVFDDVEGLKPGNNVWFSGVKIGNVKEIKFYGTSQVQVIMDIEESSQKYIRQDAKAKISSESLIGNQIIEIMDGTQQAPPVVDGSMLQSVPSLNTDDIMKTLQENNENFVGITKNLEQITSQLVRGEGTIGALLADTTLADNFRSMVASLQQTSANTVRASNALTRFTSKLNTEDGLASELLTDTTVFNQLQASVAQLQQATTSATQMANNLQEASGKLNGQNSAVGVLLNDQEFANQLQSTMQNLKTGTEKLDQNMEALQHNFLLRGFFKKQDKRREEALEDSLEQLNK
ncbi:MCE family protein [Pontibacter sp. 172403-2]|uniref:MlaD family protein n=1 Tax=Pontibacter rufus TaxID=2791028 RepID=UPI0018AFEB90|nr:MlaD family protein [Pontibacter sp. 172403-2]MBF9254811.1 MCE family protein [Pontibacter sp. 172403-2]